MLVSNLFEMKDPEFIKLAIQAAVKKTPSRQELDEQKISFVMASVSENSGVTREQVRRAVSR